MLVLEIIKKTRAAGIGMRRSIILAFALGLLLLVAKAQAQATTPVAYYSKSAVLPASDIRSCPLGVCSAGAEVSATGLADLSLAAKVYLPVGIGSSTKLRLQLNGTAPAGFRAGVLLTNGATLLGINGLGAITLRTYLSSSPTPNTAQDTRVVAASAAQAQLLATNGQPQQLELISTKDFDQVEIEFAAVLSLGSVININYAYGIGANQARTVAGYISRVGGESVSGCAASTIQNPANAADTDLSNYASFGTLATLGCPAQLKVKLEGTAPGSYQAGFVIGNANNLLDAGLVNSGLVLSTYDNDGQLLESSSASSLLGLNLLPDGRSLVSFQATKPFAYVSIERTGLVTLLDNTQLYYGVGVASTTLTPMVLSNFADGSSHYKTYQNGVLCVNCGVTSPANAAGSNNNAAAVLNVLAGVASSSTLRVDLNGVGKAGNRAGMVLGATSLVDVTALNRLTLSTYDDAGNVLETAAGSSLLALNVLPDGRQTVSFNTTKPFSKVSITQSGVLGAVTNTDVYYGFADDSNGALRITNPAGPLPVSLTSFAVRRGAGGAAAITWTTASEANSASFVVERAANPAADFTAIGQVAAAGSSSATRRYALQDPEAATQAGPLYYRLRQLDVDGSAHLSAVAVLAAGPAQASFSLYPNPAPATARQVTISAGPGLSAGSSVSLYSPMGQLLSSHAVGSERVGSPLTLPTAGLAAGTYYVVLRDAAGQALATQRLQVAGQ